MGGSSKSVTVGYKYYVGMHMVLTHGPVDKLLRVQVDERTAWQGNQSGSAQISINSPELFGGESREGGIQGAMDFEVGSLTQGKNSYLLSKLGSLIPAFRGVTGVVLRQMYMGLNPYLKKWSFRLSRVHTRQKGVAQWYDAKAEIEHKKVNIPYNQDYWKYLVSNPGDNSDYSSPSFNDSAWPEGLAGFGSNDDGGHYTVGTFVPSGVIGRSIWIRKKIYFQNPASIGDLILDVYHDDGAWIWWNGSPISITNIETYYAIGNVPASLIQAENTVVLKVTDGVPSGTATNIFGAVSIRSKVSLPQYDMNPAHIIRECLTDPDWGMGYQDADIDDASFIAAADRLYDEEMGMSIVWDTQTSIEEFIKVVVKHIDAALYVDRQSGKFVLKLIRADFDVNTLIVLDESNIDKIADFSRPSFGELTNSVTVTYWNAETGADSTITVQDIALQQMQGASIGTSITYSGFTNSAIATRVAQRDLRTLSTPLISCTIYANRDAADLNIGKCFRFTWPDYDVDDVVMRVTGIAYGDGKTNRIRLQCVQDIFSLPDVAFVQPSPPAWEDPSAPPTPVIVRKVFEIPYLELVQTVGQQDIDTTLAATPEVGYIGAAAGRPSGAISSRMFSSFGGAYTEVGNLDFSPYAVLTADLDEMTTTFAIQDGEDLDQVQLNTWLELDSEIMAVTAISDTSITVKRGCLDTSPKKHLAGAYLIFWDNYAQGDNTELVSSDVASVKICPVTGAGQLALESATADSVTIVGRAARPYPPANVKINNSYFPKYTNGAALSATWVHRDRKQQTASLVGFTEGSIGPESGTTYTMEFRGETNALQRTYSAISGKSQTWNTEATDCGLLVQGAGYYHNESFVTAIPSNYGVLRASINVANCSSTFDGSTGAMLLESTASQFGLYDLTSLPLFYDFDFEVDMEILTDAYGFLHSGIWMTSESGPVVGYRFATKVGQNPEWYMSKFPNSNWTGETILNTSILSNPSLNINERRRIRVVWSSAGGIFNFYVDGVLVLTQTDSTYKQLRPGIFFFYNKTRVHEIKLTGHVVSQRLNNQVTMNLAAFRGSLSSYQPFEFKTTRVGYGYSYGLSYGGL